MSGITFTPPASSFGQFTPADHGYLTWTYDPAVGMAGLLVPAGGTLNLIKLKLDQSALITNIVMTVVTGGATLTSGQNFALLYSSAGVLLGQTATQHTAWQSSGLKTMALNTPVTVGAGMVYAGFYCVGSTLPNFSRGNQTSAAGGNAGLAAPNLRHATADTGLTTTPPDPFGAQTSNSTAWWVALS